MSTINLDSLLQQAETLPAFPAIVSDILNSIDDPLSVPEDFTKIISKDQVLVTKILKFANSAFYGFPREIATLKEAIIILGLDTLKSIVIAISAYSTFRQEYRGYGLGQDALYQHSVCCAMIARVLAKRLKMENKEKYFIAALLHDVGKLLLDSYVYRHRKDIIACTKKDNMSLVEAEKRVIGFDHCYIGSKLAESWNLPSVLVNVIRHHHSPDNAPPEFRDISVFIYAANLISYRINRGVGIDLMHNFDDVEEINRYFPVTEEEIVKITRDIRAYSDENDFFD